MLKPPVDLQRQIAHDIVEIRALAATIDTPVQFERLMAAVLDPDMRIKVRALIVPLLNFPLPEEQTDGPTTD